MGAHEIHSADTRIAAIRPSGIAALTAACALMAIVVAQASRADTPWFTPPPGWQAVDHPPQILGAWVHPGDTAFHQSIVAGAERTAGTATQWDEAAIPKLRAQLHEFVLGADVVTTSCGKPAHYISYASVEQGHKIVYEHMTTVANGMAFFVIYARLSTQPSLPEARDSLTTLCGGDVQQHPSEPTQGTD